MPAAPRHAKPKTPAIRLGAPVVAAATLAGVAAAFVFLHGGSAAPGPSVIAIPVTSAESAGFTNYRVTTAFHRDVATLETRIGPADQDGRPAAGTSRRSPPPARAAAGSSAATIATQHRRPRPRPGTDAIQRRRGRRQLTARGLHPQRRRGRQLRLGTRQRRRCLPVPARHLGKVRRRGRRVRRGQAPPTRIRYSTTPSPPVARRTGRLTTGADDAPRCRVAAGTHSPRSSFT